MLAQGFDLGTIFRHESPPKPMLLPHKCHFFNGNVLGLGARRNRQRGSWVPRKRQRRWTSQTSSDRAWQGIVGPQWMWRACSQRQWYSVQPIESLVGKSHMALTIPMAPMTTQKQLYRHRWRTRQGQRTTWASPQLDLLLQISIQWRLSPKPTTWAM